MKALSVRNPFAHFIFCGEKEFEFRTWKTDYRGDLLICSSAEPKIENTISGHALCVVQLNEIFEVTRENYRKFGLYKRELPDGKFYAWQLTNVRIIKPFPVKGKLNLFNVDDDLIEIIDDGSGCLSEEEAEKIFKEYIEPLLYKK